MPKLTLIRGLPGSGKSTLAQKIWQDAWSDSLTDPTVIPPDRYEADDFFTNSFTGEYRFNSDELRQAHDWCYFNVVKSLRDGVDVIVSNTFTRTWEYGRYLRLRDVVPDLDVRVIEVRTQYKSIHGVPHETVDKMRKRWEPTPAGLGLSVEVVE